MYLVEEFDREKTRVFKYITYKKRTEYEVRTKFRQIIPQQMLEDIIDYLKEAGYLNDGSYIERAVNEFMALKYLSIKEMKYKLKAKGIKTDIIEKYFDSHEEELKEYEKKAARHHILKRINSMEGNEIRFMLLKKGYLESSIKEELQTIVEDIE